MIGFIVWREAAGEKRRRPVVLREDSVLHMRFLKAEILRGEKTPETVLRRRVLSAGKRLHRLGITRAVLPEAFPYGEVLDGCGVRPVSTLALRRALAADWLGWELERQGRSPTAGRIALSAEQLTGELVRTVTEVALRHRYVLLDLPYGGEELCHHLRREYGISVLLNPEREQLEEAEALLLFEKREELRRRNPVVLPLYDESVPLPPISLLPAVEEKLPAGADRVLLVAALREAGALRTGQITFANK
ncbi:MAG: hypothetical protein E7429_04845 [Ruminococcaceae bacterium]|nr:hypothetical protein [Oscillospiraceae bacterium]